MDKQTFLEVAKDLCMLATVVLMLVAGSTFVAANNEVEAVRTTAYQALNLLETEIARNTPSAVATPTVVIPGVSPSQPPAPPESQELPQHVLDATERWHRATVNWSLVASAYPEREVLEALDADLNAGFNDLGLETRVHLADMLPTILPGIQVPLNSTMWAVGAIGTGVLASVFDGLGRGGPRDRTP